MAGVPTLDEVEQNVLRVRAEYQRSETHKLGAVLSPPEDAALFSIVALVAHVRKLGTHHKSLADVTQAWAERVHGHGERITALEEKLGALHKSDDVHAELDRLRAENGLLRATNERLRKEKHLLKNDLDGAREENAELRKQKNGAYSERNKVVASFARLADAAGLSVSVGKHKPKPGEAWEPDWLTVLFVELPTGQVSWHFHDSEVHLLDGLPRGDVAWDGHSTEEKYQRLHNARPRAAANVEAGGWPTPQPIETAPLEEILASDDTPAGWVRVWPGAWMDVEGWRVFLKKTGRRWWVPMPPPPGGAK